MSFKSEIAARLGLPAAATQRVRALCCNSKDIYDQKLCATEDEALEYLHESRNPFGEECLLAVGDAHVAVCLYSEDELQLMYSHDYPYHALNTFDYTWFVRDIDLPVTIIKAPMYSP